MDYLYALQCIREVAPDVINFIFLFLSEYLLKAALVFMALSYWCIDKREGATLLLGYAGAYQFNQLVKNIACVYRPWILDSRLHVASAVEKTATGYSFPSGHTISAGITYGGIAAWQKKRTWVVVLMSILVLLTAFSRNWLGAHTMKDVVFAVIEAGVFIIIANFLKFFIANNPEKDTVIMIAGNALAISILIFLQLKKYPMDYDSEGMLICNPWNMMKDCYTACGIMIGGFSGWWLERRFVKFSTECTIKQRIIRGAIGIVVFAVLYFGGGIITKEFIPAHVDHLVKYFVLFFCILFVYPFAFTKIEKIKFNRRK